MLILEKATFSHCLGLYLKTTTPVFSQPRAVNVDLQTDATLQVDISDALSERDKVKFTVHTKVNLLALLCFLADLLTCHVP